MELWLYPHPAVAAQERRLRPDWAAVTYNERIGLTNSVNFAALHSVGLGPPLPPWSRDGAAAFGGITAARSARWRGSS